MSVSCYCECITVYHFGGMHECFMLLLMYNCISFWRNARVFHVCITTLLYYVRHITLTTQICRTQLIIIIIIKRISRAPIYHTRWQHRALYNNTNHTHTYARMRARTHARTCACAHTHSVGRGDGQGCEKQFRNNY